MKSFQAVGRQASNHMQGPLLVEAEHNFTCKYGLKVSKK